MTEDPGFGPKFDSVIHAPIRLRVCGILRRIDEIDFAVIRDTLEISDASLSKHLKALSDAGYVSMKKTASLSRSDSRRVTWVKLTGAGREAFDSHIAELHVIAHGHPEPSPSRPPIMTWNPTFGATPELG
ncbi:transcriptional regulator [Rhodococcus sp. IEGM 1401]|uniref:transcriptional regulator n=1 Tax=unclassified Rhodococcus (in: high G+C Gram-positive bacteria) TaxID=192944 RepID=UPI0022B5673F|nr:MULTISPECIES: transcriptional regulator [unclassified Rhodococcus (in: high G+C Gram-positive bacteria)]MCZ4560242.1 transcriptional regulator [Rhodococcus sp. IEGM 1401]MDI9920369.1 transcriptional regulator [Rhodococcus sp. IEGM 1372]MDV8032945.1 transcriptional regulator [Rhodococcus sp. IEGM 1414]